MALPTGVRAQNLVFSVFERYLESLRVQAPIPGLSAVIVQDGVTVWERGLGYRDVEAFHPAQPDTPYPISGLTQTFTSALLLQCFERGKLDVDAPIGKFLPNAADAAHTLRHLATHVDPGTSGGFRYAPARFGLLARPVEECGEQPFRKHLTQEILSHFGLNDAVPGRDIGSAPDEVRDLFDARDLERYARILERMATPYRIDGRGRALRSDQPAAEVNGSHGLIASARDLARFDAAMDAHDVLLPATLDAGWANATFNGAVMPTGAGWFVQDYNGEKLVWQFGLSTDAFSSLILKVPGRRLTLILLANSDGLSAPYALERGDVTSSLFARTFLRLFL